MILITKAYNKNFNVIFHFNASMDGYKLPYHWLNNEVSDYIRQKVLIYGLTWNKAHKNYNLWLTMGLKKNYNILAPMFYDCKATRSFANITSINWLRVAYLFSNTYLPLQLKKSNISLDLMHSSCKHGLSDNLYDVLFTYNKFHYRYSTNLDTRVSRYNVSLYANFPSNSNYFLSNEYLIFSDSLFTTSFYVNSLDTSIFLYPQTFFEKNYFLYQWLKVTTFDVFKNKKNDKLKKNYFLYDYYCNTILKDYNCIFEKIDFKNNVLNQIMKIFEKIFKKYWFLIFNNNNKLIKYNKKIKKKLSVKLVSNLVKDKVKKLFANYSEIKDLLGVYGSKIKNKKLFIKKLKKKFQINLMLKTKNFKKPMCESKSWLRFLNKVNMYDTDSSTLINGRFYKIKVNKGWLFSIFGSTHLVYKSLCLPTKIHTNTSLIFNNEVSRSFFFHYYNPQITKRRLKYMQNLYTTLLFVVKNKFATWVELSYKGQETNSLYLFNFIYKYLSMHNFDIKMMSKYKKHYDKATLSKAKKLVIRLCKSSIYSFFLKKKLLKKRNISNVKVL